jgi:hypothetical protein
MDDGTMATLERGTSELLLSNPAVVLDRDGGAVGRLSYGSDHLAVLQTGWPFLNFSHFVILAMTSYIQLCWMHHL